LYFEDNGKHYILLLYYLLLSRRVCRHFNGEGGPNLKPPPLGYALGTYIDFNINYYFLSLPPPGGGVHSIASRPSSSDWNSIGLRALHLCNDCSSCHKIDLPLLDKTVDARVCVCLMVKSGAEASDTHKKNKIIRSSAQETMTVPPTLYVHAN
jgi:hypothetical protein